MKEFTPWSCNVREILRTLPIVVGLMGLSSCDKMSELSDKVSSLWSEEEKAEGSVSVVGEKEGKAIIAEESRIVLLEFYSDT